MIMIEYDTVFSVRYALRQKKDYWEFGVCSQQIMSKVDETVVNRVYNIKKGHLSSETLLRILFDNKQLKPPLQLLKKMDARNRDASVTLL
jgi:cobalamin biosynthesis protein CobT